MSRCLGHEPTIPQRWLPWLLSLIRYYKPMSPGELIRTARARHNLSQERLARRVGTRQSAISRLEADEVSPSMATLELLMRAMGESVDLTPAATERRYDPVHRQAAAARSPAERLALGISWNRMASRLRAAGRAARDRP
jgi:transcriptional regulator with XRE-family HTH domain